jgi:asparaginyl-tRNA synthetase
MRRIKVKQLLQEKNVDSILDKTVTLYGWIRTVRKQKSFAFIELNDGSCLANLQIILEEKSPDFSLIEDLTTGAAIQVEGKIVKSPGQNQSIEIHASQLKMIGKCDPVSYPLQKKQHSFEFLRTIAHLRPRTNTQGAVTRVRNALAFATHKFFQNEGFYYIATPIISPSDCEGGGNLFQVTTLDLEKVSSSKTRVDYKIDFFQKPVYLTVSGQLNAEAYACALSDVYTFGPTFRAENSNTSRHLAEFWMIEPEMAFCDLDGNMEIAQKYLKYVLKDLLENSPEDMTFFDRFIEKGVIQKLQHVIETPFEKLTYTKAIELLEKSNEKFEYPVAWGIDLQAEHEKYLVEKLQKPVVLVDYPKEIKAFYMRENADHKTVAAMDILVPRIGELVGGSQREERLEILEKKMEKASLKKEDYGWYLELRKYGSVPHAGFGVGFERLVQFATGMENIRDVIPFPRYPGHADF